MAIKQKLIPGKVQDALNAEIKELAKERIEAKRREKIERARKRANKKAAKTMFNDKRDEVQAARLEKVQTLTARQEHFCRIYVACGEAKKSYQDAGFTSKSAANAANRLLAKPHIQLRIQQLRKEVAAQSDLDFDRITRMINDAYNGAMEAHQFASAIRAAELLGKHIGMFVEEHRHKHIIEGVVTGDNPDEIENDIKRLVKIAETSEGHQVYAPADSERIKKDGKNDDNN